jgi:Pyrimidine dimer DNA glycosylase
MGELCRLPQLHYLEAKSLRLWSLHPSYLDSRGLVALWREALLAQKVLKGETRGYRNHPQLCRFKEAADPLAAIAFYLKEVCNESARRGYRFNSCKISSAPSTQKLPLTKGQLRYEFALLCNKLSSREPEKCNELDKLEEIAPHPLFYITDGDIATWERAKEDIIKGRDVK